MTHAHGTHSHRAVALVLVFAIAAAGTVLAETQPRWERGVRWTPELGEPFGFPKTAADALDAIVPGRFIVDPPTIHNLGFRWYIEGDAGRQGKVEVAYRRKGETSWREALPMLRVHHEVANLQYGPWRCGNLFAGSVMFLESGTEYEVRFTMIHPDGAGPPSEVVDATAREAALGFEYEVTADGLVVSVSTREEPPVYEGERTVRVLSPGHEGPVPEDAVADLAGALAQAQPGDVILIQPGLYIMEEAFVITVSGEPGRPIVLRGSDEGPTVISGPLDLTELALFDVSNANHIQFENLLLRRARLAIDGGRWGGPGASWLVVRGCRIEDVRTGVLTTSEKSEHWHIADNIIVGRNPSWHPRSEPGRSYMAPSSTGVNVYGQGHVVAYNYISRFGDSLAIANVNLVNYNVQELGTEYLCNNIDFHHNDMSVAQDDIIETDYGCHNIRVYRNRGYNAYSGISMQPTYGGPIYVIRNEMYAMTRPYKKFNFPTGYVFYHNTSVSQGSGITTMRWSGKSVFRNNIFIGGRSWAIRTGSLSPHTSWDYNAYSRNHPELFIHWSDHEERQHTFASLEAFAEGAGHERHGIEVDHGIFVRAPRQRPLESVLDPNEFDLRLRPGAAPVEAAVRLPNINDDYTGAGPDIGAHELGHPLPHYGPRPDRRPRW